YACAPPRRSGFVLRIRENRDISRHFLTSRQIFQRSFIGAGLFFHEATGWKMQLRSRIRHRGAEARLMEPAEDRARIDLENSRGRGDGMAGEKERDGAVLAGFEREPSRVWVRFANLRIPRQSATFRDI